MPDLDKALFAGKDQISPAEWASLTTSDMNQRAVAEFLESYGWDQRAAAHVGLKLAADNTSVVAAQLALAGKWRDGPIRFQASKIFEKAPANVCLEIDIGCLSTFRFAPNEMWSDTIAGDKFKHTYVDTAAEGRAVLTADKLEEYEITAFSIRAVTSIAKSSGAKCGVWLTVTILAFPATEDAMLELSPLASDPAWPGIRLSEGDVAILPPAGRGKTALGGKAWGSPITPGLVMGAPWQDAPGPLAARDVAAAIGGLLNRGCPADASVGSGSLSKKWDKLRATPADMRRKKPEKTWPTGTAATAKTGWS